jgi:hypothetical protein
MTKTLFKQPVMVIEWALLVSHGYPFVIAMNCHISKTIIDPIIHLQNSTHIQLNCVYIYYGCQAKAMAFLYQFTYKATMKFIWEYLHPYALHKIWFWLQCEIKQSIVVTHQRT